MKKINGQEGFTLIEVVICVAILSIIFLPLLYNFVTAAKTNKNAELIQDATAVGQKIIETFKESSEQELFANTVNTSKYGLRSVEASSYTDSEGKKKEYNKYSFDMDSTVVSYLKGDGKENFTATVTMNPLPYMTNEKGANINVFEAPEIPSIVNGDEDVSLDEVLWRYDYTALSAFVEEAKANLEAAAPPSPPEGEEAVEEPVRDISPMSITKEVTVEVKKLASNSYEVAVKLEYSASGVQSFVREFSYQFDHKPVTYLYCRPYSYDGGMAKYVANCTESVILKQQGLAEGESADVYLLAIKQNGDSFAGSGIQFSNVTRDEPEKIKLYTNLEAGTGKNSMLKKNPAKITMYDIQVTVWRGSEAYSFLQSTYHTGGN